MAASSSTYLLFKENPPEILTLHLDHFRRVTSGAKAATDATFSTLGLRTATRFDLGSAQATFRAGAGWRHAFGDRTPVTQMRYVAGGNIFQVAGLPVTRDAATVEAGLEVAISGKASLGISYSGQFGDRLSDQTARASFIFKF
ncbi:MAG: hypothetical protein DI569_11790 [Sphingopyxis macrogoltabida]|uniref:Autotransporter domain-containing protein n=1 Tax=Sphingopyxis macrogoltabida TaxID=33050 RepID=A0A2W5L1Y1_SPHMC|nr:MAG: hypothetical protein DI569_11790 [Sphingopyxis macrogoltabida]